MIVEDKSLHNRYHIFESRRKAGFLLGSFLESEHFDILYIIPNGGVPVGLGLLEHPSIPANKTVDLLIVRKIQIPGNTEAGMGAITPDGQVFFNEQLISYLSLSDNQLKHQIELTKHEIKKRRTEFLLSPLSSENISGNTVLITDDGIASGFSILAGTKWLKQQGATEVIVAVPTAPKGSIKTLEPYIDKIICLNIRDHYPFAVADAYTNWYDLTIFEAKKYLSEIERIASESI
jgi:predicted phosphoribosyltransferase